MNQISSSPLRRYFASSSASGLPVRLRAQHAAALGLELEHLAAHLVSERSEQLGELTELAELAELASAIYDAANALTRAGELDPKAVPAWVSVAQRSGDYVDVNDLPLLIERIAARIAPRLEPGTQSFVELYLLEAHDAFDVFRQRFQVGQDLDQIITEVFAGLENAMRLLDEAPDAVNLNELAVSLREALADWSAMLGDMGVVVDLELIRQLLLRVAVPHQLGPRIWSLLILRLDRALSVRAENRLAHAFGDAIEALLTTSQRLEFIRDLRTDAYPYLAAESEPWGELAGLMMVLALRPGSRLEQRFSRALNLHAVADWSELAQSDFTNAVRLGANALRARWERNFLDLYRDAATRLVAFARAGSDLLALDTHALEPSSEALLTYARAAVALGYDVPSRRSLLRVALAQFIGHAVAGDLAAYLAATEDAEVRSALSDLFELAEGFSQYAEPFALAHLAPIAELEPSSLRWLQRFAGLHRIFDAHQARAEMRATLARSLMESREAPVEQALASVQALLKQHPVGVPGGLGELLREFEPSLRAVSTAVKIARVAPEVADVASAAVLTEFPEYAERITESGRSATRRDNYFTMLRLAQVLGAANSNPKESMVWWWLSTIGVYLRNRDQPVMQGNLRALLLALAPHLAVQEQLLAADILAEVYRKGLAIDIPRDLTSSSPQNFRALKARGPLWHAAFTAQRTPAPHHALLSGWIAGRAPADPAAQWVLKLWGQFDAQWRSGGDPQGAWCQLASETLQHVEAESLQRAWLSELVELRSAQASGVHHVLLVNGLECIQLAAFGLALAPRVDDWAARMVVVWLENSTIAPAQAALFAHKAEAQLAYLLRSLAEASVGTEQGAATLNALRYLLECVLPYSALAPAAWQRLWNVLTEQSQAELSATERAGAQHYLARFSALTQHAEALRAIAQLVFVPTHAVFSEDPAQESDWRALVAGLLGAATACDAGLPGEALAQSLALASPLFNESPVDFWREAQEPLRALLTAHLKPKLRAAFDRVCLALERSLLAEQVYQGAPASPALDVSLTLRAAEPSSLALWRIDRVIRVQQEGLTTPLPGDLTVVRATGWLAPDRIAIGRSIAHLAESTELSERAAEVAADSALQAFQLGVRRLALLTCHLRDGIANPHAAWLAGSLSNAEWSELSLAQLEVLAEQSLATLDEQYAQDSTLASRITEVLAAARAVRPSPSLQARATAALSGLYLSESQSEVLPA